MPGQAVGGVRTALYCVGERAAKRPPGGNMKPILRACRYLVSVAVIGCIVMFGIVTLYAVGAAGSMILQVLHGGFTLDDIAHVTVYAFKVLDLFLIGTILYIVALGLAALFLDSEAALPRWFKVRELQDLKFVLAQSIVVVMLVGFLLRGGREDRS
jgi:uncharacterized membrane protein YqhA